MNNSGTHVYTCPTHPEVRSDRQCIWPTCGMAIAVSIPVAANALYPFFKLLLIAMILQAAMCLSSVSVIGNALRLRRAQL